MDSIAVIPARRGSKRIPKKNIKLLAGKPAIAYSIESAIKSDLFKKVIVSTDDPEIAEISLEYGAEVPFFRSADLSDDFTITVDVIADAILKLEENGEIFQYACCIYPVTPLLRVGRLIEAAEILKSEAWDYVFPAIEFATPPERGFRKKESGEVEFRYPEFANTRTQDIKKTFHDAGQFYFGKTEAWINKRPLLNGNTTFIELSKNETIDIDDFEDWLLLEKMLAIELQTRDHRSI